MGLLTKMLTEAFSSTTLNESATVSNAIQELLDSIETLPKMYKALQNVKLPNSREIVRDLNAILDNNNNESFEYFMHNAPLKLKHIRKVINRIRAMHIWFTEAVPVFMKQLGEDQIEYLADIQTIYKNGFANFVCLTPHMIAAFKEVELKDFKARKYSYKIQLSANELRIISNIPKLY